MSSGLRRRHRDILLNGSELWGTGGMFLRQLRTLGIDVGVGCRWYWFERGVCGWCDVE